MSQTAVAAQEGTPVERYVARVLPPGKRTDIARALPSHVSPERFERNLANAVMSQPKLRDCDPNEVFFEVMKLAALGLLLDPQLGEAYLIADNNKKVQARVGYRGLIKLAKQSDVVTNVYAHDVCAEDFIQIELGTNKHIKHEVDYTRSRGEARAFYAVVEFKDGPPDFEVMTLDEINAIRDRSDAWKAYQRKLLKSTPWATDPGEMAKKTVLRRLLKRVPMAPERAETLAALLAGEDASEFGSLRDVTPRQPSIQHRLRGPQGQGFSTQHVAHEMSSDQGSGAANGSDTSTDETGRGETETGRSAGPQDDQSARDQNPRDEEDAGQQSSSSSSSDDGSEFGEQATEAYVAGRMARREGVGLKAMPTDMNLDDQRDWRAGWQDEDSAQKGKR
jgi:recombination protein RecT